MASGRCHQHLGFKKGMAIASLNINGLRSHLDEVQLLIRDLGIQILALNETKLDPEFPKELTGVAGYQQERMDRTPMVGLFPFTLGTLSSTKSHFFIFILNSLYTKSLQLTTQYQIRK